MDSERNTTWFKDWRAWLGLGIGAAGIIWSARINPLTSNLTLLFGATCVVSAVWLRLGGRRILIRIALTLAGFAALGVAVFYLWTSAPTSITVSPPKVSVELTELESHIPFEVHNDTSETLFSVWVKVTTGTKKIAPTKSFNFGLGIVADDGRRFVDLDGMNMKDPDVLQFIARGKDIPTAGYLVFRAISPHETRRFKLVASRAANSQTNRTVSFHLSVVGYKSEPYPLFVNSNTNEAAVQLTIPESLTFKFGRPWVRTLKPKAKAGK